MPRCRRGRSDLWSHPSAFTKSVAPASDRRGDGGPHARGPIRRRSGGISEWRNRSGAHAAPPPSPYLQQTRQGPRVLAGTRTARRRPRGGRSDVWSHPSAFTKSVAPASDRRGAGGPHARGPIRRRSGGCPNGGTGAEPTRGRRRPRTFSRHGRGRGFWQGRAQRGGGPAGAERRVEPSVCVDEIRCAGE